MLVAVAIDRAPSAHEAAGGPDVVDAASEQRH
jgi:hypothetical protein